MARLSVSCQSKHWKVAQGPLEKAFDLIARVLELSDGAMVDLVVCSDQKISALNRKHFEKRGSTDVIAFPMGFDELARAEERYLGEIYLCADTVARSARARDVTLGEEFLFVFVHGVLHLLGRRDDTPARRKAMLAEGRKLTVDCLRRFGSARGLLSRAKSPSSRGGR